MTRQLSGAQRAPGVRAAIAHGAAAIAAGALTMSMAAAPASAEFNPPYPRLASVYLLGSVDPTEIPALARHDVLVLNTVWPDTLLRQMRELNPDIKIFVYNCHYCLTSPVPTANTWEQEIHDYVETNDLWWYNRDAQRASDWVGSNMINVTKIAAPGPHGRWSEYLSRQVTGLMTARPNIDGIYYDNFYRQVSWQQVRIHVDSDCNPTHTPAGCNGVEDDATTLDALWNDALRHLAKRTRSRFDSLEVHRPNIDLAIMGGRVGDYFEYVNGGFYENFPLIGGGDRDPGTAYRYNWNRDMFEYPEGYLVAPMRPDPFSASILNANQWGSPSEPARSPDFERYKRFTLGSALLGDGFYSLDVFTHSTRWWEMEYDNAGRGKGYLGYPLGTYTHAIEPTGAEMVVNGSFTAGVGNPWFGQATGGMIASLVEDQTDFHSAPAAAKIDVQSYVTGGSFKLWQSVGPLTALGGYTLSFWAKASEPQELILHIYSEQCPNSRCFQDRRLHLTTEWKRFQIPFLSTGNSSAPGINIFSDFAGDVWFDDVSLRPGDTSLYRRDFDRGTVLVNYTTVTQTVDLGGTYYNLDFPGSSEFNGSAVTSGVIPASDARIFLTAPTQATDTTAPASRNRLDANEPNPFNPTTRIRYALAQSSAARMTIFDVAGRRVRILVDAEMPAGDHVVTWDGRDDAGVLQPSGVYWYRIEAPGFTRSRRMTLVR